MTNTLPDSRITDASTLAAWCSRSSLGYNEGAWQTALLLQSKEFRREVASELVRLDLPSDHPAMTIWARELNR